MNLNDLRVENRKKLAELLYKLRKKFREKYEFLYNNNIDFIKYFENLGIEVKINGKPFLGSKDFVPIEFSISMSGNLLMGGGKRFPLYYPHRPKPPPAKIVRLSVPVGLAEKVLVLGDLP